MTLVIQQMREITYIIVFTLKHTLTCFGPRGSLAIIAHRLSTVVRANQTLVLHKGTIVERGTHQELLDMDKGYYNLWQRRPGRKLISLL
jgi:ABC-type transport system involved in Fe-S cluster assembly fused permease/ATPase subunit